MYMTPSEFERVYGGKKREGVVVVLDAPSSDGADSEEQVQGSQQSGKEQRHGEDDSEGEGGWMHTVRACASAPTSPSVGISDPEASKRIAELEKCGEVFLRG